MEENVYTVNFPEIGEGVVEGEIIEWLKQPGDSVRQNEPVVVVMTDKATVELSAPYVGVLLKQHVPVGQHAIRDRPIYDLKVEQSVGNSKPEEKEILKKENLDIQQPVCPKKTASVIEVNQGSKAIATPKVRHLAHELGVDLNSIIGSGPNGQVLALDLIQVEKKNVQTHVALEGDELIPLKGVRGLMAHKMDQHRIPQFSYFESMDVSSLLKQKTSMSSWALNKGIRLSYMPFFIKILSTVATKYPELNGSIDMHSGVWIKHKQHNFGIAMASPDGLIVPVLKGIEKMTLAEVIEAYEQLKIKARDRKLSADDMKQATLTISNFGVLGGGTWATPMINGSEVAILALGKVGKAAVVVEDQIVIRDQVALSWSFDHRLIDGELAASISKSFCEGLF